MEEFAGGGEECGEALVFEDDASDSGECAGFARAGFAGSEDEDGGVGEEAVEEAAELEAVCVGHGDVADEEGAGGWVGGDGGVEFGPRGGGEDASEGVEAFGEEVEDEGVVVEEVDRGLGGHKVHWNLTRRSRWGG